MFYQLEDEAVGISAQEINSSILTLGYISEKELEKLYKSLGFSARAYEECVKKNSIFSSRLELFDSYAVIRLDVDELNCRVTLLVSKNLVLAVTNDDKKRSLRDAFMSLVSKINCSSATEEKAVGLFLEEIMNSRKSDLEELQQRLNSLEEAVFGESTENDFNKSLLEIKNGLLCFRSLCEQVIEICEGLSESENRLFDGGEKGSLKANSARADRFKEKIDLLRDSVNHIWDSYQAFLDIRLNQSMKRFTLLTTVFFPITIIVGWYGMNFKYMPELSWKYGYAYVAALTVAVVAALFIWLKKRKWL